MVKEAHHWAPLILRLALGFFCVRLGIWGYVGEATFKSTIESYTGLQGIPLTLYLILGPYLLFGAGSLLILGLFTRAAALVAIFVFAPLLIAGGAISAIENPMALFPEQRTIFKDLVVLAAFGSLLFSGPGAISIDNTLKALYRSKD